MSRGAIVVICSDGLDRGDPAVLAARDGAAGAAEPPDRLDEPAQGRRRRLPAEHARHDGRRAARRPAAVRPRPAQPGGVRRRCCPSCVARDAMSWSVSLVAEGDRVMTSEEIVELADAVAAQRRDRVGHRHDDATARSSSSRRATQRRGRRGRDGRVRRGRRSAPACRLAGRARRDRSARTTTSTRSTNDPARLARRLPVRGPRVLAGWTPPARRRGLRDRVQARARDRRPTVRGHLRRPRRRPLDRAASRSTTRGRRAGSVGPATAGSSTSAPTRCRAACARTASRSPRSSPRSTTRAATREQYDQAWKDEWIGEYTAPTTGPLTTGRDPATGQS